MQISDMEKIDEKISFKKIIQISVSIIGLIAAIIAIYTFFFQDKSNELDFEIITNTNVLDINADITKLDITYDGTSLKANNENLRLYNIRIKNIGKESILKTFYDDNDPLGLIVKNGRFVEKPELISTSNDYLKENLKITSDSTGKIKFNNVILEPNEFFTIKLLVLHPIHVNPEIIPKGKIAGIKYLTLISQLQQIKEDKPFLIETFGGNIFSQLLRALAYSLVVLLIVFATVGVSNYYSDYKEKVTRAKTVKEFKSLDTYTYNGLDEVLFTQFLKDGSRFYNRYIDLLSDETELNKQYSNWISYINSKKNDLPFSDMDQLRANQQYSLISTLLNDGFVIKDHGVLLINKPLQKTFNQFVDFLVSKGDMIKEFK